MEQTNPISLKSMKRTCCKNSSKISGSYFLKEKTDVKATVLIYHYFSRSLLPCPYHR